MEPESYKSTTVLVLSQMNPVHPHPISLRSILISSYHLHLGLFSSGFPTKTMYAFIFYPLHVT
jgi:hypothetical protein